MNRTWTMLLAAALIAGSVRFVVPTQAVAQNAAAPDAKTLLDTVSAAMGAANLRTIQFTGNGSVYNHGQAMNRFGPLPRFDVKSLIYSADYVTPGSRVERVRNQGSNPPRGGSPQPLSYDERNISYLNGNDAWGHTTGGQTPPAATMPPPARQPNGQGLDQDTVEQRQIELWETPHGFVIAAMKSGAATVKEQRTGGKRYRVISFPRGKTHMDGYINDENLVEKVETWIAHPVLGDLSMEMSYGPYRDWNGVKFPTKATERWGGETVLDLTITDVKPNVTVDVTVPQNVRNTPLPPVTTITTAKLEDGVYDIGGQNANTIAVEFKDYIVAIEAGTHQERSNAVIAEIKKLFPSKRIGYLINTHAQYNDHAAGVRPYAAEGATIITHKDNQKWFQDVAFKGAWTIEPDKLSQMKTTPKLETVDDSKTLTDGSRQLVMYHIKGNQHDAAMLMVYMPVEKWIIVADSYSTNAMGAPLFGPPVPPPNAPADFPRCCDARNFYDNVIQRKLDVKTIVPIHGVPAPWETVAKFLGR